MKPYTRRELVGVILIFCTVLLVTVFNMSTALRRSRDSQRRNDIGAISDALNKFQSELGFFPLSDQGKIKMCKGEKFDQIMEEIRRSNKFEPSLLFEGLRPCEWGRDALSDVTDPAYTPYMKSLPSDPRSKDGYDYLYLANEHRYQLYTALEGESDEIGYDVGIVKRNLACGNKTCSYGKTFSAPLDKSIEEYEKELLEKGGSVN